MSGRIVRCLAEQSLIADSGRVQCVRQLQRLRCALVRCPDASGDNSRHRNVYSIYDLFAVPVHVIAAALYTGGIKYNGINNDT